MLNVPVVTSNQRTRMKTRKKLVDAAIRIMAKKGIGVVIINEITDEADVDFGSVYNDFKSRAEIAIEEARVMVRMPLAGDLGETPQVDPTRRFDLTPIYQASIGKGKLGMRAYSVVVGLTLLALASSATAEAREPGAGNAYPAGTSIGLPTGSNPPPGLWLENMLSYYSATATSGPGTPVNKTHLDVVAEAPRFLWTAKESVLGASEMAFVVLPVVDLSLSSLPPPNPSGSFSRTAVGNPGIAPINLAWNIAPATFAMVAIGASVPIGQYSRTSVVNIGNNFWTIQPEAALSYLGDGWDLTAHLVYNTNTKNKATNYTSGDQLFLDLTATKTLGKWEVGAVGYYDKQLTADRNGGGFYGPPGSGLTFGHPEQFALGALLGYDFGPLKAQAYLTQEVVANEGAVSGTRIWTRLFIPL